MTEKQSPLQKKLQKRKSQKRVTKDDVYSLCEKGYSLNEIAVQLEISPRAAATYIERLLRKRYAIGIDRYVPPEKRSEIEEQFLTLQTASIKHIKESMQGNATEEEIRIVRGYLQGLQ